MIAFASFIVVPEHASALDNIRQPVLEWVLGGLNWFRDTPHGDFSKSVRSQNNATANQRDSLHVGHCDNTHACCQ